MQRLFEPSVFMFEERARVDESYRLENFTGNEELLNGIDFAGQHAILPICERFGTYLDITPQWAKMLHRYVYNFTTRRQGNVDFAEFFGSPYLGLQKIVFTTQDRNEWFSDIFDVDEIELRENLHEISSIKSSWAVVGDVFNLTIPYLLYRINKSKLDNKTKHQAMVDVVCMYHYKCLSSIVNNDYKYQARREVVLETYNRLSLKYDIKKYGSWRALIIARAEFILSPVTGIHYKTFTTMSNDKDIIYMVGDIQDRLRGVVNDINKVFHDVKNQVNIVKIDGVMVGLKDKITVKDMAKEVTQFKNYIEQTLTTGSGFYKEELVGYAAEFVENANKDKLTYVIQKLPEFYNSKKGQLYQDFVDETILHLFEYLHANDINKSDIYNLGMRMKGAYTSHRSLNESVKKLRTMGDEVIKQITGIKTPITITSLRTALLVYIDLRTLAKDYYQ